MDDVMAAMKEQVKDRQMDVETLLLLVSWMATMIQLVKEKVKGLVISLLKDRSMDAVMAAVKEQVKDLQMDVETLPLLVSWMATMIQLVME
jgi:hypothetical protein